MGRVDEGADVVGARREDDGVPGIPGMRRRNAVLDERRREAGMELPFPLSPVCTSATWVASCSSVSHRVTPRWVVTSMVKG
jgi:hypothetical protein